MDSKQKHNKIADMHSKYEEQHQVLQTDYQPQHNNNKTADTHSTTTRYPQQHNNLGVAVCCTSPTSICCSSPPIAKLSVQFILVQCTDGSYEWYASAKSMCQELKWTKVDEFYKYCQSGHDSFWPHKSDDGFVRHIDFSSSVTQQWKLSNFVPSQYKIKQPSGNNGNHDNGNKNDNKNRTHKIEK